MAPLSPPQDGPSTAVGQGAATRIEVDENEPTTPTAAPATRAARGRGRWISWAVWAFLSALVVLAFGARLTGMTNWVIVSGSSMEPTFYTGDLILIGRTESWDVGDTVMYSIDIGGASNYNIIHRLVSGDQVDGWQARGDNKPQDDPWTIPDGNIAGEEILRIPAVGNLMTVVRAPLLLAIGAGVLAGMAVWAKPAARRPETSESKDEIETAPTGRRGGGSAT